MLDCSAASFGCRHQLEPQTEQRSVRLLCMQARYAAGVRKILEDWFEHKPFPEDYYIVREGQLAPQYR